MFLKVYDKSTIQKLTRKRSGEIKLGECVQTIDSSNTEDALKKSTAKLLVA